MLSMNGIIICELILGTVLMSLIFTSLANTDLIADTSSQSKHEMPVRYLWDKIAGEGIIKDLSLRGSYIAGNASVAVGMALARGLVLPNLLRPALFRGLARCELVDFGGVFSRHYLRTQGFFQAISRVGASMQVLKRLSATRCSPLVRSR